MNDILGKELIFLIKYLEKKPNNKENFDQLIIVANGFEVNIHDFMDSALLVGGIYVETIRKHNGKYTLKLTERGLEIADSLTFNNPIVRRTLLWKLFMFIREIIEWIIVKPLRSIPKLFRALFSNTTAKIILFIMALAGGIVAFIQLYKWYSTGEI